MYKIKYLLFPVMLLILLQNCNQKSQELVSKKELEKALAEISVMKTEINELKAPKDEKLVHMVFLKLKKGLQEEDIKKVVTDIEALKEIQVLTNFKVGKIADTGDKRFISDHDIVFQMNFKSMDEWLIYQNDTIHLQLKETLKPYLEKPQVVYDYWIQ